MAGPIAIVMAVFIAIMLLIFLTGGGLWTAIDITKALSSIPGWLWVIIGIILLLKFIGGKKK